MPSAKPAHDLRPEPGQCVRLKLGYHCADVPNASRRGELVLDIDPAKLRDKCQRALRTKGGYSRLANGGFVFRALHVQEVPDA